MNNSSQCDFSAPQEDVRESSTKNTPEKTVEVSTLREKMIDTTTVESNPKIDHHLLSEFYRVTGEYERLVAGSKGIIRKQKQGADYNIAHPLASRDRSTDAHHRGTRVGTTKES